MLVANRVCRGDRDARLEDAINCSFDLFQYFHELEMQTFTEEMVY